MRARTIFCAIALVSCVSSAGAQEPPAPVGEHEADGRVLLRQLNSEDFQERLAAQRALRERVQASPELLAKMAREGSAEVSRRALRLLEQLFVNGDEQASVSAERLLMELAEAADESTIAAQPAAEILAGHQDLRQQRAVAAIEKLGGKVDWAPDLFLLAARHNATRPKTEWELADIDWLRSITQAGAASDEARTTIPRRVGNVMITSRWSGGIEGLWHLSRLQHVDRLKVLTVTQKQLPDGQQLLPETVSRAVAGLSNAEVEPRGPALGVRGEMLSYCRISEVLKGGAADQAGLREGDVVLSVNGDPIRHFADLIESIKERQTGETVEMKVQRFTEVATISVTLASWEDIDTESHLWTEPRLEPMPLDMQQGPFFLP